MPCDVVFAQLVRLLDEHLLNATKRRNQFRSRLAVIDRIRVVFTEAEFLARHAHNQRTVAGSLLKQTEMADVQSIERSERDYDGVSHDPAVFFS